LSRRSRPTRQFWSTHSPRAALSPTSRRSLMPVAKCPAKDGGCVSLRASAIAVSDRANLSGRGRRCVKRLTHLPGLARYWWHRSRLRVGSVRAMEGAVPRSNLWSQSVPRAELDQRSREARLRVERVERLSVPRAAVRNARPAVQPIPSRAQPKPKNRLLGPLAPIASSPLQTEGTKRWQALWRYRERGILVIQPARSATAAWLR
jgi:hypothetical protein